MSASLKVKGMSCQHCVRSIQNALSKIEGIRNVHVDLARGEVMFDNPTGIAITLIESAIRDAGYEVI